MRLFRSVSAVAALAVLASCDLCTAPNVPDPIDPAQDTYASSLGVNIASMTKTSTGLYYKNKVVGTGTASAKGDSPFKVVDVPKKEKKAKKKKA